MKRLRILVVDDHAVIREGLKLLIDAQPDMTVVGDAGDGREAWQKARELRPDIVIMDISMPEVNGVQATERLKQDCPDTRILALTMHEDEDYVRRLLKSGASGYLLKRAVPQELIQAIRLIAEGTLYVDPTLAGKVISQQMRKRTRDEGDEGEENPLSERETEVLRLLAWGYSNKEIATQLNLGVKTIETYKARLMQKLNLHNRAALVRYALRRGWLEDR